MRRMEELSSSTLSLDEVDDVIQDEAMWRDCIDVSDKLGDELPVSTREMNTGLFNHSVQIHNSNHTNQ